MMKKLVLLVMCSCFLYACGSDGTSYDDVDAQEAVLLQEVDLTGTWRLSTETDRVKDSTGEVLVTSYHYTPYIFEETDSGVKVEPCAEYGGNANYGVKTTEHFYTSIHSEGYSLVDADTLFRETVYVNEHAPGFTFVSRETFERVSVDVILDRGELEITGDNVNFVESDHVCVGHSWSSLGTMQYVRVIVPYDDDTLEFSLTFYGDLSVGSYQVERFNDDLQIQDVEIYSNANSFWDTVGSNILYPESATVEITNVNAGNLAGRFEFVGRDDGNYTGQFNAVLP